MDFSCFTFFGERRLQQKFSLSPTPPPPYQKFNKKLVSAHYHRQNLTIAFDIKRLMRRWKHYLSQNL